VFGSMDRNHPEPSRLPACLEAALQRLTSAIEKLDAAEERRLSADAARANLQEEVAVLQDDRLRLARELDSASALCKSLDSASQEVSRKLSLAIAEIEVIIAEMATREE